MPKTVKYIGSAKRWPELSATGKQSVWYPGQIEDRSDAEASQLLATGLFQLYEEALTPAQVAALHATQAEAAGVHYNNTAAQNTAAFNTALARRGMVSLMTPGQYMIGGAGVSSLLIPSQTTLIVGAGVDLILADDSLRPIIMNESAWHASPITLAAGIAYGSLGNGLSGTATHAGIGLKHPVGSWIAVSGLNLTQLQNRSWHGVYQVFAATPDSITFNLIDVPPNGNNSSAGAVIHPADFDIRIISQGAIWDGNDAGQDTTGIPGGDSREHTIHFRNARNAIVSGPSFRRGASWSLGVNNIRDCTFERLSGDLYGDGLGNADMLFQGSGCGRNVLVQEVRGQAKDNLVAWSLDSPNVYTNHAAGDTYNITFRQIDSTGNGAPILALWGNTLHRHHSVTIDGVTGRTNSGGMVTVDNGYVPTAMYANRGGKLKITNIDGNCPGAPVLIRSDGDWDVIEIDGVRNARPATGVPLVSVTRRDATQTIRRLSIRNVIHQQHQAALTIRTGPAIELRDSNIDDLRIEGLPPMALAENVSVILHAGTLGVIKRAVVEGATASSSASGDSFIVSCENTGAGSLGALTIRDAHMTGTADTGGVVRQTGDSKVATIRLDNATQTGGEGVSVAEAGSTAVVTTVSAA